MRKLSGCIILCLVIFTNDEVTCGGCISRQYNHDSIVCVCNNTDCDDWESVEAPERGSYAIWTTSRDGARAQKSTGKFDSQRKSGGVQCTIDPSKTYQKVRGFGGAITDSAGINIMSLDREARDKLMESYFSPNGLEYSICRVPIGGTDFSTRPYTYADNSTNHSLDSFALQPEDYKYKIPLIKQAQNLTTKGLKLYGCMWGPPAWMKTNNNFTGLGLLRSDCRQQLADYHKRFLDAYKENGLDFTCISTGNEPVTLGLSPFNQLNALGTAPNLQADWIAKNLGPTIRSAYPNVCILTGEDQRTIFPWWLKTVMDNKNARQYVDGIAAHWYLDDFVSPLWLDQTHDFYPNIFIINTEASIIATPTDPDKVALGSWSRAEAYARNIIQDFQHWVTGWIDWNIALDTNGGPTWAQNYVDSPIIVNKTANEFYKQPMYYIIGHFSKFCSEESRIIYHKCSKSTINMCSCKRRNGSEIAIAILNTESCDQTIIINNGNASAKIKIPKKSMTSLLYLDMPKR